MRANDFAMIQRMPRALITSGACSLEEPHPKFFPATMISPCLISPASSGLKGLNPYCFISSTLFSAKYSVGIMISVSMSSPKIQTLPVKRSIDSPLFLCFYCQCQGPDIHPPGRARSKPQQLLRPAAAPALRLTPKAVLS